MSWSAPLSSELQSLSYLSEKERDGQERNGTLLCTFKFDACAKTRPRFAFLAFSTPELFSIAHDHESYSLLRMTTRALVACDLTLDIGRTQRRPRSLQLSSQAKRKFELFWDKHTCCLLQLVWRNIKGHTEAHVGKSNLWWQSNLLEIKGFILYIMRHTMCFNIQ